MTIKNARRAAGLTQVELAELAGCHRTQIQKIERGEILLENLTAALYLRLCRVLALDPWEILNNNTEGPA